MLLSIHQIWNFLAKFLRMIDFIFTFVLSTVMKKMYILIKKPRDSLIKSSNWLSSKISILPWSLLFWRENSSYILRWTASTNNLIKLHCMNFNSEKNLTIISYWIQTFLSILNNFGTTDLCQKYLQLLHVDSSNAQRIKSSDGNCNLRIWAIGCSTLV